MQCVSHKRRHDPGRVVQEDQAVAERKTAARKFLQGKKISFLKNLVPRNNKLSQVTVCLFLGPKGLRFSYFIIYKITKGPPAAHLVNSSF